MFGSSEQTAYFHTLLEKFTQEQPEPVMVSAAVTEAGEDEPIYAATGFCFPSRPPRTLLLLWMWPPSILAGNSGVKVHQELDQLSNQSSWGLHYEAGSTLQGIFNSHSMTSNHACPWKQPVTLTESFFAVHTYERAQTVYQKLFLFGVFRFRNNN